MKRILIVLGTLLGLVALVAAIGSALPKGHVARRSARYSQPPDSVWAVVTDFGGQAAWRSDLKGVEAAGERSGKAVWQETSRHGDVVAYETTELEPPRRLVRTIADPSLPYGGRWIYELTPVPGGSRLTITEHGEVYNPIFRFMSRFMDMGATASAYLTALGTKFGETTVVEKD